MHKNLGNMALPCLEGVGDIKLNVTQPLKMQNNMTMLTCVPSPEAVLMPA